MAMKHTVYMEIIMVTFGSPLKTTVSTDMMEKPLPISLQMKVLPLMEYSPFMKIKKAGFGLAVGRGCIVMTVNHFLQFPRMVLGLNKSK